MTSVLWFRRDLRLGDHPALTAAAADGDVVALFVVDPRIWDTGGPARRAWISAGVRALDEATGGALVVRLGDPAAVVTDVARRVGADVVHVSAETTPYGRRRDARVAAALAEHGIVGRPTGTPYAVDPGTIRTQQGGPYQVFTPFSKAWFAHGHADPLPRPTPSWADALCDADAITLLQDALQHAPAGMPEAGEDAALRRWREFLDADVADYDEARDLPAADRTSR
ncbi:MAG: deoxyribodipyrimidine photo-lyase, partial [Marmoricola sp.]